MHGTTQDHARNDAKDAAAELLFDYMECLRAGQEPDPEAYVAKCPAGEREELKVAMEGADALEAAARQLRPFIGPEARERALRKLKERLAKRAEQAQ